MTATKQPWERALSRDVYTEFQDRRVIIAGVGANNIGAALAEGFHALGARVAIIGYDRDPLTKLADRLDAKARAQAMPRTYKPDAFAADLTNEEARLSAVADACVSGGMPIAYISTLGNDRRTPLAQLSQDQLRKQSLINWEVPVLMAASLIEPIRIGGGGAICLFSSHHGANLVDRNAMAYGSSKAALDNAINRLAHEAAIGNTPEVSVRVIGVRPGWVQSQAQLDTFSGAFQEATRAQLIPLEMRPHDLVAPVVSLVSTINGGLISGVTVPVDGGRAEGSVRDRVFPPRA